MEHQQEEMIAKIKEMLESGQEFELNITVRKKKAGRVSTGRYIPWGYDSRLAILNAIKASGRSGLSTTALTRKTQHTRASERAAITNELIASGVIVCIPVAGKTKTTKVYAMA